MITTEQITEAIQTAKLEYDTDIVWNYENTILKHCLSVHFYKDEMGKNYVEEFCVKIKDLWVTIEPTDEQYKLMWKMLDDTPYREEEKEVFGDEDNYENNGVKPSYFY